MAPILVFFAAATEAEAANPHVTSSIDRSIVLSMAIDGVVCFKVLPFVTKCREAGSCSPGLPPAPLGKWKSIPSRN